MKIKTTILAGVVATFLAFSPTAIADPAYEVSPVDRTTLPGTLLHNPMAIKWDPVGPSKRVSIVESEGVPGLQAIEFQVKRKNIAKPWDVRMRAPFDVDVSAGETVEIYFWARASKLPKGREAGKIGVVLGRNKEPYDTIVNTEILPTGDWKMYKVTGVAERDFPTSESDMGFDMAFLKQTIEFGPYYAVTRGVEQSAE